MARMEREIELAFAPKVAQSLTDAVSEYTSTAPVLLSSLLGKATTLAPKPAYQRLEFLVDSVLAFHFTVTLFATNCRLRQQSESSLRALQWSSQSWKPYCIMLCKFIRGLQVNKTTTVVGHCISKCFRSCRTTWSSSRVTDSQNFPRRTLHSQ